MAITDYRDKIETHLIDKESEMDKTTTYITVGLLGFFMTINDKFVPLLDSNLKIWMYISICSLIFSLILGLVYNYITVIYDGRIIRFIDDNDVENDSAKKSELDNNWEKYIKKQNCVKLFVYIFLGIGLITEIVFTIYNFERKSIQTENIIKVEVLNFKNDTAYCIRTANKPAIEPQIKSNNEKSK